MVKPHYRIWLELEAKPRMRVNTVGCPFSRAINFMNEAKKGVSGTPNNISGTLYNPHEITCNGVSSNF